MKKIFTLAALALCGAAVFTLHAAPAEIYLLRHAEKLKSADKDPKLSACGLAQAQAMAKLVPSKLTRVYHSGYQRTEQTAQQIMLNQAEATLHPYNAGDLPALAAMIQQNNPVLVVGHSNTTPQLIHLLSQLPAPKITEQDYGVVYQLKQSEQGYALFSFPIQQPAICLASGT